MHCTLFLNKYVTGNKLDKVHRKSYDQSSQMIPSRLTNFTVDLQQFTLKQSPVVRYKALTF